MTIPKQLTRCQPQTGTGFSCRKLTHDDPYLDFGSPCPPVNRGRPSAVGRRRVAPANAPRASPKTGGGFVALVDADRCFAEDRTGEPVLAGRLQQHGAAPRSLSWRSRFCWKLIALRRTCQTPAVSMRVTEFQ